MAAHVVPAEPEVRRRERAVFFEEVARVARDRGVETRVQAGRAPQVVAEQPEA